MSQTDYTHFLLGQTVKTNACATHIPEILCCPFMHPPFTFFFSCPTFESPAIQALNYADRKGRAPESYINRQEAEKSWSSSTSSVITCLYVLFQLQWRVSSSFRGEERSRAAVRCSHGDRSRSFLQLCLPPSRQAQALWAPSSTSTRYASSSITF
jgi:hypothetical protein